jgi:protoporphyrinogen oxidase
MHVIIGAGPAGLTLALELQAGGIKNIVIIEADHQVGGISKTVIYKDNRIDIGGHRFFSKSDWVMNWWTKLLPIHNIENAPLTLRYQGSSYYPNKCLNTQVSSDDVMLVRNRLSRIYYNRKFFDYPLKLNLQTLIKLGFSKTFVFGMSYLYSQLFPILKEKSLEDFLSNRFGRRLYLQFFKQYTEKVWGVPCSSISAEWGAQRIKSLSIIKALIHSIKNGFGLSNSKAKQTSLIEHFIYPKFGPGQMWELAAKQFINNGGQIITNSKVSKIYFKNNSAIKVSYLNPFGDTKDLKCSTLISTMPIKELFEASHSYWSNEILSIARGLQYRDFITVGLLYYDSDFSSPLSDNWIYIQEPGVQVGRIQIFNNWSPSMVARPDTVWLGLEFFCTETDNIWKMSEDNLKKLAQEEIFNIGLVKKLNAIDAMVLKVPKAYPGYFGESYEKFGLLRKELDNINNLFLIGRNGMHRYNNQDHSMLTAKEAASQIISGKIDKKKIWDINIGDDYHEISTEK